MRTIPGYSCYCAKSDGTMLSLRRGNIRRLSGYINEDGYLTVTVINDHGKKSKTLVHRLIALAFLGPAPFGGAVARHLDGNQLNNRASNIAWGTVKDNYLDAIRHGTRGHGESIGGRILDREHIIRILSLAADGRPGKEISHMLGVSPASVSRIKNARRWPELVEAVRNTPRSFSESTFGTVVRLSCEFARYSL